MTQLQILIFLDVCLNVYSRILGILYDMAMAVMGYWILLVKLFYQTMWNDRREKHNPHGLELLLGLGVKSSMLIYLGIQKKSITKRCTWIKGAVDSMSTSMTMESHLGWWCPCAKQPADLRIKICRMHKSMVGSLIEGSPYGKRLQRPKIRSELPLQWAKSMTRIGSSSCSWAIRRL